MDIQTFVQHGLKRLVPKLVLPTQPALNLGAGRYSIIGAAPLDYPAWDADYMPIPAGDESVGTVWALHFLEHIRDPVGMLRECERVLRIGGTLNVVVPHAKSEMALMDVDHKHFFTEESWRVILDNDYYTKHGINWKLRVHANFLFGVAYRNLAVFTQFIKVD